MRTCWLSLLALPLHAAIITTANCDSTHILGAPQSICGAPGAQASSAVSLGGSGNAFGFTTVVSSSATGQQNMAGAGATINVQLLTYQTGPGFVTITETGDYQQPIVGNAWDTSEWKLSDNGQIIADQTCSAGQCSGTGGTQPITLGDTLTFYENVEVGGIGPMSIASTDDVQFAFFTAQGIAVEVSDPVGVPEPGSWALLALGVVGILQRKCGLLFNQTRPII